MAATVLSNIVYPIRAQGQFIRHYTPGRWWDSLYTWDSGFVGLGLVASLLRGNRVGPDLPSGDSSGDLS